MRGGMTERFCAGMTEMGAGRCAGRGALCWARRDTRGKRGYDRSARAGVAELLARAAELSLRGVTGVSAPGVLGLFGPG